MFSSSNSAADYQSDANATPVRSASSIFLLRTHTAFHDVQEQPNINKQNYFYQSIYFINNNSFFKKIISRSDRFNLISSRSRVPEHKQRSRLPGVLALSPFRSSGLRRSRPTTHLYPLSNTRRLFFRLYKCFSHLYPPRASHTSPSGFRSSFDLSFRAPLYFFTSVAVPVPLYPVAQKPPAFRQAIRQKVFAFCPLPSPKFDPSEKVAFRLLNRSC